MCSVVRLQTLISLQTMSTGGEPELAPKYVRMFQVKRWPSSSSSSNEQERDDQSGGSSVERHFTALMDLLVQVAATVHTEWGGGALSRKNTGVKNDG